MIWVGSKVETLTVSLNMIVTSPVFLSNRAKLLTVGLVVSGT